jgi:lipopolysaccharide transport system permease protein
MAEAMTPIVVVPKRGLELPDLHEVWEFKDLLFFLIKRDLKVRFQQTFIGVLWIVLQPLIQMLIFFVIFGIFVRVPTDGIPYPVFYLSGYVVWQLFLQIVNSSATSLLGNIGIITKIYFPRLTLPLSTAIGALIDFLISFSVLMVFLLANNYPITARYILLPFLVLLTMVFSEGVGLLFGALMVVFRDTKNLLGFILQIWMFITPIMYTISIVPEQYKIFFYLNPLTGFIGAYRWIFLGTDSLPTVEYFVVSSLVAVAFLIVGMIAFRSMENKIADVM